MRCLPGSGSFAGHACRTRESGKFRSSGPRISGRRNRSDARFAGSNPKLPAATVAGFRELATRKGASIPAGAKGDAALERVLLRSLAYAKWGEAGFYRMTAALDPVAARGPRTLGSREGRDGEQHWTRTARRNTPSRGRGRGRPRERIGVHGPADDEDRRDRKRVRQQRQPERREERCG